MSLPEYAELHCVSNFTFLRGASSARELVERAKRLNYRALAVTDECTLAGIVRAHEAAKEMALPLVVGSEIRCNDGLTMVLLAESAKGYSTLCRLITLARRNADKGTYTFHRADLDTDTTGLIALWIPAANAIAEDGKWIRQRFPQRAWLAVELHRDADDAAKLRHLTALGQAADLPLVAAGNVHMHVRKRRALQDTLTAIRHRTTVANAGDRLYPNGERHLRTRQALADIYPRPLLEESVRVAARCTFSLDQLHYTYPHELVPKSHTAASWLRHLTEMGARWRWPQGTSAAVKRQLEYELALITELAYESFFLTVHDIVNYARQQAILCQGRGSAANSVVCFCLGITEVDPARSSLLFERFISRERNEPPDIDVDFEHERREEVIQYIYNKYGRERTALAATVICYRPKSAVRDVAKALGLSPDQVDQLSRAFSWQNGGVAIEEGLRERGFNPEAPVMRRLIALTRELIGFPRHLSQHVGGFVISEHPLHALVPVENAAMPDRTIIQWDKDDLDALGLLKVDCLALGMLTCLRKCFNLIEKRSGKAWTIATIPAEDKDTYGMIQRADTIGVFQIESRAQMAMLPRLKPANFYDLVIEIAIVRPGPIQGKMVHPYLRRRQSLETVNYPSDELRAVLNRTLGVPLFQEQVMQLVIVAAGFTPGEADQLRRSMAAWKRHGGMEHLRTRILDGMNAKGYQPEFAERVFEQIKGFGSYGFPESHAASFALLTYASCWLKCHEPAAFACALMNSQPMGFYSTNQIVQDLRRHGVRVRPIDVRYSDWDATLEEDANNPRKQAAIRLGLREIRGLSKNAGVRIETARRQHAFKDVADLCDRAALDRRSQAALADAAALRGLAGHRHRARWAIAGTQTQLPLFGAVTPVEARVTLAPPSQGENTLADYASTGLTLGRHPLALIRRQLTAHRCRRSSEVNQLAHGTKVRAAGLVTLRQRPGTASGVTFLTVEDEHGTVNVVVWRDLIDRQRRALHESRLLAIDGVLESVDGVQNLIAHRLIDLSAMIDTLDIRSRDFH